MKENTYIKYMEQSTWFHGTTFSGWKNLCKEKVRVDYNKGTELDFGYGFYLTPKYKQAENYIRRMIPYLSGLNIEDQMPIVIEFELNLSKLDKKYSHSKFLKYNEEFAEFVLKNRMNPDNINHSFDYVIGVMSDSNPEGLLADYRANIITREELIIGLQKGTSMEQLSLHNQGICDILKVKKAILVEEGKELNADDYNKKTIH